MKRIATVVAIAMTALTLLTGPAQASPPTSILIYLDPVGDYTSSNTDVTAPREAIDISQVRASRQHVNKTNGTVFRIFINDVPKNGTYPGGFQARFLLDTPTHGTIEFGLNGPVTGTNAKGVTVACTQATKTYDAARDTINVYVNDACVGKFRHATITSTLTDTTTTYSSDTTSPLNW